MIRIGADELEDVAARFGATPRIVERAVRATVGKVGRWSRTRVRRGLARELDMPQRVFRRRVLSTRVRSRGGRIEVEVFVGLNPIPFDALNPRQTRQGLVAKKRRRPGAFLARMPSGKVIGASREGKSRLPIRREMIDIRKDGERWVEREFVTDREFAAYFMKTFEHEIKWRMDRMSSR